MSVTRGDVKWKQGRSGEQAVKEWFRRKEWFVVPTADIENGGAPMLDGQGYRAVLPDLMASMQGFSCWVEVKTKTKATEHRNPPRRFEHGLQLRHWKHYLAVEEQTGIPGYLAILELDTGLLLLGSFKQIEQSKRLYLGSNMPGREAHIFFDRAAFDWHEGPDSLVTPTIAPQAIRTIEQRPTPVSKQLSLMGDL